MKKAKLFKVILAAMICFVFIGANVVWADAAETNLLTNGDFTGSDGWEIGGDAEIFDYEKDARGKVGFLKSQSGNARLSQEVTLKKNTDYILKAKVLVVKPGAEGTLGIKDRKFQSINKAFELVVTNDEAADNGKFKEVELEFNSGSTTEGALCFYKWTQDANDSAWASQMYVGDIELREKTGEEEAYEVIWKDEFDGTGAVDANGLDLSNWGYELGCVRGVEQQHYTKDKANVHVTDGKLVLEVTNRAEKDQYKNPRGNRQVIYNSGSVRTHGKQEFLFGRIEVLAKLPSGQATFPAFWTLGADFTLDGIINDAQGDEWPLSGEIDIMESIGDPKVVYQTLHYSDTKKEGYTRWADNGNYAGNGKRTSITSPGKVIDGENYHVFGIEWSPGRLEWYVDDQVVRIVDYHDDAAALAALDRPQYIQLNFATGGNWAGDAGSNLAGQTFKIESVYYTRNAEQQAAAEKYYANTAALKASDVTITQGTAPDLLKGVSLIPGSGSVEVEKYTIDYSVDNEYMFTTSPDLTDNSASNDEARTKVECMVGGVSEQNKLAELPAGEYNLHYSALCEGKPSVRKTVKLTVVEAER